MLLPRIAPLVALVVLTTSPALADEIEVWSFTHHLDFKNKPLGNRFVLQKSGELRVHRGQLLREVQVKKRDLLKAELAGQPIDVAFIKARAGALFAGGYRTFELGGNRHELGAIKRVLTQQYADNVILEAVGRLCRRDSSKLHRWALGKSAIGWGSLPGLYRWLSYEQKAAGTKLTIIIKGRGQGPESGTGSRKIQRFRFEGLFDSTRNRFTQIKVSGVVLNTVKKIEQTLTYEQRLVSTLPVSKDGSSAYHKTASLLMTAVGLAERGRHKQALALNAALAKGPGAKRFAKTRQEYFAGVQRDAEGVAWQRVALATALGQARREGKPVLLLFDQENCPPCMLLKKTVLTKPTFVQAARRFVPLNLNACVDAEVAKRYKLRGTPTVLILDPEGKVLARQTGVSGLKASLAFLNKGLAALPKPVKKKKVWY